MTSESENIKVDLHLHTYYSDGIYSPEELISKAKNAGLSVISITDHDNVDAINEAVPIAKESGLEIIPGVEISAEHNGKETHILAYYIDHNNEELLEYLRNFRKERMIRARKIVNRLNELNIQVTFDEVLSHVKGNASIGRPHIAMAMVDGKYVDNYYDAFNKYLGDDKPAYVKKPNISVYDAVRFINKCGGLSFVAHPGKMLRNNNNIYEIIEAGIDGIEIIHPSHTEYDIAFYQDLASQYFLLESGGSDFHGGRINEVSILGRYFISEQKITAMKNRLFVM
ncbi:MAG TPA: PHP domain-containing protein [Ignavibacteria bacterium]|nr:PHP domain-containing protein [Ignavibacteria bacterium]